MAKEISIRVAKSCDRDAISDFLSEHYYKEEPLTNSHPQQGYTKDDMDFTMSHLKHDTVLIATDNESGEFAGVIVAGPVEPGDADAMVEMAKKTETRKWREISFFLAYIEKKSNVLERFNLPTALHVHVVGVHKDYRGQRIGEKLFSSCFENAKRLNYPAVTADATSVYTIKFCERLGMECVSLVTYDEYNKTIGESLFRPREPNFEIKTYLKRVQGN